MKRVLLLLIALIPVLGFSQENYCIPNTLDLNPKLTIGYVQIGDFINTSTYEGDYTDFTDDTITVMAGESYILAFSEDTVWDTSGNHNLNMGYRIWVDWDKDLVFKAGGIDNEIVYTNYNGYYDSYDNITFGTIFTEPVITRIRIRNAQTHYPFHPCDYHADGETEDYTLKVISNPLSIRSVHKEVNITRVGNNITINNKGYSDTVMVYDLLGNLLTETTSDRITLPSITGIYLLVIDGFKPLKVISQTK